MKLILSWVVFVVSPLAAYGETLTAVCGDITGVSYEKSATGKIVQKPDKMLGGELTVIWSGGQTVTVSSVDLRGRPQTWDGNVINHRNDAKSSFLTFVVPGPWRTDMYTIDLREKTLLQSSHYPGSPFDAESVNTSAAYIGTCKVGK